MSNCTVVVVEEVTESSHSGWKRLVVSTAAEGVNVQFYRSRNERPFARHRVLLVTVVSKMRHITTDCSPHQRGMSLPASPLPNIEVIVNFGLITRPNSFN